MKVGSESSILSFLGAFFPRGFFKDKLKVELTLCDTNMEKKS